MASSLDCAPDSGADLPVPAAKPALFPFNGRGAGSGRACHGCIALAKDGIAMKFALINPNWNFEGSTYFGCQEPHYPLELMFACDQIRAAGHEPLLMDAQVDNLNTAEVQRQVSDFAPEFV